ncbi:adhesion G-protein coupled receptor G2 isoform X2 [Megalobrama amblycephala]|uniref:adhesion G-protein coupled receptor G2 isoform X2 n=1 Tax=Megalobrama amblycephala TaxID=75352 RepID=UPI0020142567|nr:adhesion G-protein coupled receptor G2 isoform X2 [Megalobrama amblycephala]
MKFHLYLMKLYKYLERLNVSSPALQMFLRKLEILSRMKWNSCGLLLILSNLFCISAVDLTRPCEHNPRNVSGCPLTNIKSSGSGNGINVENDIFILGADGFMGYWKTGYCNKGLWSTSSQINSTSLGASLGALPGALSEKTTLSENLCNITVFKFESNCTGTTPSTTHSSECGVYLSRDSPYELNISRSFLPTFVCLMEGKCRNGTWTNWIVQDCKFTLQNDPPRFNKSENCSMTCLNPTKACENAGYDPKCSDSNADDKSKMNTIGISNKTATCFKCGSPFKKLVQVQLPPEISNKFNNSKTGTDAATAAGAMKNLTNMLSFMGNLTEASISMGSVKGVLKKIQNVSDIKMTAFTYSSDTGLKVIDDFSQLKNFPNTFTIPKEASLQAFNKSAGNALLGLFRFPNMTQDEKNSTVLGDEVYAIEMGTEISNLTENISLVFSNKQIGTPACNSWDGSGSKPNWTTEGCFTVVNGSKITCNCQHLTFFAVLMAPPDMTISESDLVNLTYITYIGCGLSMFFLGVAFFIHFLLRKVKATNSAHVLMNLFFALFLLNVAFLTNEYVARANSHNACKLMAAFMHYCLLASFTWFAVEALHLCLQMARQSVVIKHYILKISVIGWVPPALIVSILFVLSKYGEQTIRTESSNVTMCWILDTTVHYTVNIGYYCFVFIFTFSTCIVVLRWLSMLKVSKFNKAGKVKRSGTATLDVTTVLGLCCMLGLTWSFAFFSYGGLQMSSYYIFTILNSFQGFFLFIYYVKTSTLFGDPVPSEDSNNMTEETITENPYDNQLPPSKKDF